MPFFCFYFSKEMKTAGFSKDERLKSRKDIDALIKNGKRFNQKDIRLIWMSRKEENTTPVKVVFAVPKKKFKRAVDRNLIRRRMREVYRLNKSDLYNILNKGNIALNIMFIYRGNEINTYGEIENKLVLLLKDLCSEHAGIS